MIVVFHKPYGVLSQYKPVAGKRTLLEFPALSGGKAVGRLDEDSEGLLIVSDLAWVQTLLTQPGRIEKTYRAQVERIPDEIALERLRQGVTCGDFVSAPAQARLLPDLQIAERTPPIRHRLNVPTVWLELQLKEGKNREVRNIMESLGLEVNRLIRLSYGPFQLGDLPMGAAVEVKTKILKDQVPGFFKK